jgi:hypothetical protein
MSTTSAIIFSVAFVFYLLAWHNIRQLVRELNERANGGRVSIWWWHKGWSKHRQLFTKSPVRLRIVTYIALTVGLGLVAFWIEVRNMIIHR